jgi:hypothetical protein
MISPALIDPAAVYDDGAVVLTLDLSSATLARARRDGRLRFTRKGRRVLYMGQWLLDWLAEAPLAAERQAATSPTPAGEPA